MKPAAQKEKPAFCPEKQRLTSEFRCAAYEYLNTLSIQVTLVLTPEALDLERIPVVDAGLEQARQRKDAAKQAVVEHRRSHGC